MDNLAESIELKDNHILNIYWDDSPINPRKDWDNGGIMVCFHNRYDLGDDHNLSTDDFSGWEEMKGHVMNELNAIVALPLYLYEHGGITMSVGSFSCPWDSGQVGFIYMTQEGLDKMGWSDKWFKEHKKDMTKEEAISEILEGEVESYDTYLRGETYRFEVVKKVKCDCCDNVKDEHVDSCGGFLGSDHKENGIFDHVDSELYDDKILEKI